MIAEIGKKNNLISLWAKGLLGALCLWVLFISFAGRAEASVSDARIEGVKAVVSGDVRIPDGVCARMEKSVQTIGEQLLAGKSAQEVRSRQAHYEDIIRQVFDKVLVGYSVSGVDIYPAEETRVSVRLMAWQDKIAGLSVETRIVGMPPVVENLLRQDIEGIDRMFDDMLINLPVAAADWTNGVVKHRLNAFMAERAPEFRADFDLVVDHETKVLVDIYPLLPVVRTNDLSMRSDTLPNAALLTQRQDMQAAVDMFVGVPVDFVKRHREAIQSLLERRIDDKDVSKSWGVHTKVTITPGERMGVMSRSDSDKYMVRFEGRADVGHSDSKARDNGIMVRGIIAKQFKNRDGLFSMVDFYPQHTNWDWDVGYYRDIVPKLRGHVRYDLKDKYWKGGLKYDFAPRWSILYEYRHLGNINEMALRYKLHDFLSLECVLDNHDRWLRFVGYF